MEPFMTDPQVPPFAVIPGRQVHGVLNGNEKRVVEIVEAAYRVHGGGDTVNPPSSFPENVQRGVPRASAVLILNDHDTGYPLACMEASIISAARTAASAALAADVLTRGKNRPRRIGFFGVGLIARYIHTYLAGTGWDFDEIGVHDLSTEHAEGFKGYLERSGAGATITIRDSAEDLIRNSDIVVFATVAGKPHVSDVDWFAHNPLVLHVSLRDLSPEIILASTNIVDDVDHCLKADTSPHLAEQQTGNRDFLDGTLFDVLTGKVDLPEDKPLVFSPFGLGVLDLAVGKHVHDELAAAGELSTVPDFFHELSRYGRS
jgi:2,3-diaminopropionate biosynthesis protein SbnB